MGNKTAEKFAEQTRDAGLDQQQAHQLQVKVDEYIAGMKAPHGDPDLNRWGWGNMIDGVDPC